MQSGKHPVMKDLYKKMSERFRVAEPVIIAIVINIQGSSPRKPGAKMAFFKDGSNTGTVGGGSLEAAVEKIAATMWEHQGALIKTFNLQGDAVDELGMVCGGRVQVLIAWLSPEPSHYDAVRRLLQPEGLSSPICLTLQLKGNGPEYEQATLGLFDSRNAQFGMNTDKADIELLREKSRRTQFYLSDTSNGTAFFVERINPRESLYVFGAGHVARPIVEIATMVGFRTVVLDDREKFANRDAFPMADEVIVLQDFNDALNGLLFSDDSYVVIVTRGHAHDQSVLEQVLATSAVYIGMIGSRAKVAHCFQSLKERGVNRDQLARVYAPIGLKIGSETPEEIAVSIVAQLIHVRSKLKLP
jgi:xanthine dehydrogenase accessory factor